MSALNVDGNDASENQDSALHITRNPEEAEDILQTIFLRLMRRWMRFNDRRRFASHSRSSSG